MVARLGLESSPGRYRSEDRSGHAELEMFETLSRNLEPLWLFLIVVNACFEQCAICGGCLNKAPHMWG